MRWLVRVWVGHGLNQLPQLPDRVVYICLFVKTLAEGQLIVAEGVEPHWPAWVIIFSQLNHPMQV